MATSRSDQTKRIAQRIDITYHRRPTWFRLWRRWASVLTTLAVAVWVAIAATGNLLNGRGERMLNPGPVTQAHAHFENNCAACHDHNGKRGFSRAVSDAACLKCHDATPHGKGSSAMFVSTDAAHSTNCTSCHTEHRGHAALAASDNRTCSQCHENLSAHLTKGRMMESGFDAHITAFAIGSHPAFGRSLTASGVALKPPATQKSPAAGWLPGTRLKFSHATHFNPAKMNNKAVACADCHVATRSDPRSLLSRGSMLPVTYEQNCRKCHPILLEQGDISIALTHGDPGIARGPLLDLPSAMRVALVSDPTKLKEAMKADDDAVGRTLKFKSASLIKKFSESLSQAYDDAGTRIEKAEKLKETDPRAQQLDALGEQAKTDPAAMAEYLLFNKTVYTCSKCHEVKGDLELIYAARLQWKSLKMVPDSVPPPTRLHTVPTGITAEPRRWFAASRFDHEAHRDQTCSSCHAGIEKDEDDGFLRFPAMESCVACHHPDAPQSRGAGAACIECHAYHPR